MTQGISEQVSYYQRKLQYEMDAFDLHAALQKGEPIVVIDARSEQAYIQEHIPGAFNFPHRTISKESALEYLKFGVQYVTYCDGIGCNASTKSALKLAQLGYQVKELVGGIDWWKRDRYPTTAKMVDAITACGCEG